MAQYVDEVNVAVDAATLKEKEEEFLRINADSKAVEERKNKLRDSRRSLGANFLKYFSNMPKEGVFPSIKKPESAFSRMRKLFVTMKQNCVKPVKKLTAFPPMNL